MDRRRVAHERRMAELEAQVREAEAQTDASRPADDTKARKAEETRILEEMAAVEADLRARLGPGEVRPSSPPPATAPSRADAPSAELARYARGTPRQENQDDEWKPLVDPRVVLDAIRRSRNLIIATTLLGVLLAAAYALSLPKMYASTADLLIDPRSLQTIGRDLTPDQLPSDASLAVIESQARLIDSASVLTPVIEQAGLLKDPEFNGTLKSAGVAGFIASIRNVLSVGGEQDATTLETKVLNNLRKSLTISRDPKSFLVSVTVKTREAEKSAHLANMISDVFQKQLGAADAQLAKQATGELSARLAGLKAGVENAENAVQKFKAANDLVDVQGRLIDDDTIANLNNQLSAARAETIRLKARAQSLQGTTADSLFTTGLPEGLNSSVITALRSQYAAATQQADGLATKLGPRHPQLIQAQSQAAGLRRQIEAELARIRNSIQIDLQRSTQQEQDLSARLAQMKVKYAGNNADMVKLRELEREASAQRSVYEAFLLRARETGEQQGIGTANVRVISAARPALDPLGPSRRTLVLAGLVLGLLAGLGLAILRGIYASLTGGGRGEPDDGDDAHPFSPESGESRLAAAKRRARAT
ncbi:uncharacterized protein involved in exopolysaccharide biosynthesis [Phyllobacterium leguminum]|uniref:Uncharacterized protein involved in exopolysaccharide biosynthesis n=1 Tax=Phyllobacterium leguminum TaxID=314237 RepID=A0A318TF96_9HYPH|nr:uncharacterized protein involved in exopolysaccharide biosynthesis [Phyllobacterium leguminum]